MKTNPISNVQNAKPPRRFAGSSILAWLAARASSVLRVLSSVLEQRSPHVVNDEASTSSASGNSPITATEDGSPSPRD